MFGVIYFDENRFTKKVKPKEWNNHRRARAKLAIKKQRDKAGLFGEELMQHTTVEQRLTEIDNNFIDRVSSWRKDIAQDLIECRRVFKALPANIKKDITTYWSNSIIPKEPFRFLSLIHRYKEDPLYFERAKGNATKYTKTIIGKDRKIKIVEISVEESFSSLNKIDKNKEKRS